MPKAKVGEKTNLDRREFLELKSKGDKVKIRLASSDYYYEGKHFMKLEDDSWDVSSCPRINDKLECQHCEQYFKILKALREAKEAKDNDAIKDLEKERRKVGPSIAFYYPVIDRETHLAAIFKTSLMVRLAFEEKVEEGVDILNSDFVVKRTEKPGSYYTLTKVDSAETPELTKDEKAELEKAKKQNLAEIVGGKKGSMDFEPEEEPRKESEVNPEDIPL